MDPVTQGAFGAIFAQTMSNKKKILVGSIVGCLAGLAPDLDIIIRSASDPLLKLEYHRQFTHSIIFIPIGALIVTLFSRIFVRKYLSWLETYLFSFFGYATHGLLDACTSYGTQLLWPFSDERISWNYVSVVDPFLSVPLILAIIFSIIMKNKYITLFGIFYIFIYLTFGAFQENRAEYVGKSISNVRAQGVAFDAGIRYVTGDQDHIKFAISLKNVGPPMSFSGDGLSIDMLNPSTSISIGMQQRVSSFELPSQLNIGASYDFNFS